MHEAETSEFMHKESCPKCGSRDNLARYTDGHGFCFGCQYREAPDGATSKSSQRSPRMTYEEEDQESPVAGIIPGSYHELTKRGLTLATCKAWTYQIGELHGQKVQLANHLNDAGEIVAQKVRFPNKDFRVTGDKTQLGLYGKHMCRGMKRDRLVITEGEIDALTVWQVAGGNLAVVSLPSGAQAARKAVVKDMDWINEFREVVLAFDMDDPGRAAAEECAKVLAPGKARVLELPLKDANEMHKEQRSGELYKAILNARQYKPAGLVSVGDVKAKAKEKKSMGFPWWDERRTKWTYGRRYGEIYTFGAGSGVGKTDDLTQQAEYDMYVLGMKVTVFLLEQEPAETITRIAGKHIGKCLHIPDEGWTDEERDKALDDLDDLGLLTMYDHFGSADWEGIEASIRYQYHAHGCQSFYIDHLTALAAAEEDEKKGLEAIMARMGALVKEIPIMIYLISHLATPEGKPHEEGGRVMAKHFKGSRAIAFWSHYMFGFERNQQSEDLDIRGLTIVRCIKDRFTGRATGQTYGVGYDAAKGHLVPREMPAPAPTQDKTKFTPRNSDF